MGLNNIYIPNSRILRDILAPEGGKISLAVIE